MMHIFMMENNKQIFQGYNQLTWIVLLKALGDLVIAALSRKIIF